MGKISLKEAKGIDLVGFLAALGFHPVKVRNNDYWYLSPFRNERTASFKVDRRLNLWYDHGIGKGGDLITFGIVYFNCSVSELLEKLSAELVRSFAFQPQASTTTLIQPGVFSTHENRHQGANKITILEARPLTSTPLLLYLEQRNILLAAAQPYLQEVDFRLYDRQFTAIGFQNNSGGYELRNAGFKGSSAPKDTTLIDNHSSELTVFEGFFDFLSFHLLTDGRQSTTNFLVLNSLAFLEKSRPLMEQYGQIYLLLDRDDAGINATMKAMEWNTGKSNKYIDRSDFYEGYKDLNEWLTAQKGVIAKQPQQKLKFRRSFRS